MAQDLNLPTAIITNENTVNMSLYGYQNVHGSLPAFVGELSPPKNSNFASPVWQEEITKHVTRNGIKTIALDSLSALRDAEIQIKALNFLMQKLNVICFATRIPLQPLAKDPLYRQSSWAVNVVDHDELENVKQRFVKKKRKLTNDTPFERTLPTNSSMPSTSSSQAEPVESTVMRQEFMEAMKAPNCQTKLVDVAGNDQDKTALKEAVEYPLIHRHLFGGLQVPTKGIMLHGPPGNGKTLLARAVRNEMQTNFIPVTASSLTSKWVGEDEKKIRMLFASDFLS